MNNYEKMVEELKESPYKTFIYGAGFGGNILYNELNCSGVSVDGFIVDDEFKKSDELNGKPILATSKFFNDLPKPCNVIIGFILCSKEQERKMRESNVLYMLDFANFQLNGEWSMSRFYEEHKPEFLDFRDQLCDEESKTAFDLFIEQRCNLNYRKPFSDKMQYFDDEIITLGEDEVLVDCGAFDGDTIMSFMDTLKADGISKYEKIYAFEADSNNYKKLERNLSGFENIELIPKGVYDKTCVLFFDESGTTRSGVSENSTFQIEATSIDEVVNGEKVTFIKMDIEGSELKALQGAEETIRKFKPKLAICVYHKAEDLITIPQYIKSLNPSYRFYLRNYREFAQEAVLYAI